MQEDETVENLSPSALNQSTNNPEHSSNIQTLSPIERKVTTLLLHGYTEKNVADQLDINPNTVHIHVRNIYRKLHIRARKELFSYPGLVALITSDNKASIYKEPSNEKPIYKAKTKPVSLYFDTSEYTQAEIGHILECLQSIYQDCGGDYLTVEQVALHDPSSPVETA